MSHKEVKKNIERWAENEALKGPGFCEEPIICTEVNPGNYTKDFSDEEILELVKDRLDKGETIVIKDLALTFHRTSEEMVMILDRLDEVEYPFNLDMITVTKAKLLNEKNSTKT